MYSMCSDWFQLNKLLLFCKTETNEEDVEKLHRQVKLEMKEKKECYAHAEGLWVLSMQLIQSLIFSYQLTTS